MLASEQETAVIEVNERRQSTLFSQALWYLPSSIGPAISALVVEYYLTHTISTAQYGRYALVLATVSVAVAAGTQWLQQSILRYCYDDETIRHQIGSIVFALKLVILGFSLVGICAYLYFGTREVGVGAIYAIALAVYSSVIVLVQANGNARTHAAINLVFATARLIFTPVMIFAAGKTASSALAATAVAYIVTVAYLSVTLFRRGYSISSTPLRWASIREMGAYGMPMAGWFLAASFIVASDRYFIEAFRGSAAVGIFSANYTLIAGSIFLLSAPITLALHPFLMGAYNRGSIREVRYWLEKVMVVLINLSIGAIGLVYCLSQYVAVLLLGESFRSGHSVMAIVMASLLMGQIATYAHKPMEFGKKTWLMLVFMIVAVVSDAVLNLVLVPGYGYYGAIGSTVLAYFLYVLLTQKYASEKSETVISWMSVTGKVLPSMVVTIGAVLVDTLLEMSIVNYSGGLVGTLIIVAWYGRYALTEYRSWKSAQDAERQISTMEVVGT